MSVCTKGELEIDGYTYLKDSNCKVVATTNHINGLDFEQQKANAKKLVRRWNAFEEGGIVEELRTALENFTKQPNCKGCQNEAKAALAKI